MNIGNYADRVKLSSTTNWCLKVCVAGYLSLRTSPQTGVAIPLLRGETYRKVPRRTEFTAIFGGNRYLVPFNRGIATPVCALARNDS